MHRLWSDFESGGAHNASEASTRARIAREERRVWCGKILKSKTLKYAVLGVLLAVCCYFDNLGNALLCRSYYFSTKNYKLEAVVQNDGQKVGPPRPPPPPAQKPMKMSNIRNYLNSFESVNGCVTLLVV